MPTVIAAEGLDHRREGNLARRAIQTIAPMRAAPGTQHAGADQPLEALGERGLRQAEAARDARQTKGPAGTNGKKRERLQGVPQRRGKADQLYIKILDSGIVADFDV